MATTVAQLKAVLSADVAGFLTSMNSAAKSEAAVAAEAQKAAALVQSMGEKAAIAASRTADAQSRQALAQVKVIDLTQREATAQLELSAARKAAAAGEMSSADVEFFRLRAVAATDALVAAETRASASATTLAQSEMASAVAAERLTAAELAAGAATTTASQRWAAAGAAMAGVGQKLTMGLTLPLAALGAVGVKSAGQFDQSMSVLQASSGATEQQMELLRTQAIGIGQDLKVPGATANDTAKAMQELYKGTQSINAVRVTTVPALLLAKATMTDTTKSAQTLTQVLNTFGLGAGHASEVADTLAASSMRTRGGISALQMGMQRLGPLAAQMGISFQDTATIIDLMAQKSGSGTRGLMGLDAVFRSLEKPSKQAGAMIKQFDVGLTSNTGHVRTMDEWIGQLSKTFGRLNTTQQQQLAQTIGGQAGYKLLTTLAQAGTKGFDELRDSITKTGSAQQLAEARAKGAAGAIEQMKKAVDAASLAIGTALAPHVIRVANAITNAALAFAKLPKPVQDLIVNVGLFVAAVGPVLFVVGNLIKTCALLKGAFLAVAEGEGVMATAIELLSGPIGWAIGIVTVLATAWTFNWFHIREVTQEVLVTIGAIVTEAFNGIVTAAKGFWETLTGDWYKGAQDFEAGISQTFHSVSVGAQKAGEAIAAMDQEHANAVAREKQRTTDLDALKKSMMGNKSQLGTGAGPGFPTVDKEAAKKAQEFADAMKKAEEELTLALTGESEQVQHLAGQYDTIAIARIKQLETVKEQAKYINTERDLTRSLEMAHRGLSSGVIALAKEFPLLSTAQLQHIEHLKQQVEKTDKAREAMKLFHEETKKLNVEIRAIRSASPVPTIEELMEATKGLTAAEAGRRRDQLLNKKQTEDVASSMKAQNDESRVQTDYWLPRSILAWKLYGSTLGAVLQAQKKNVIVGQDLIDKLNPDQQKELDFQLNNLGINKMNDVWNAVRKIGVGMNEAIAPTKALKYAFQNFGDEIGFIQPKMINIKEIAQRIADAYNLSADEVEKALTRIGKAEEKMAQQNAIKDMLGQLEGVFQQSFENIHNGFKGMFQSIVTGFEQMLQKLAAEYLADELVRLLIQAATGFDIGNQSTIGQAVAGGRASGGPVESGQAYMVGEAGPELFVPNSSGRIVPNGQAQQQSGHTINFTYHISTPNADSFRRTQGQVLSDARRATDAFTKRNG